MSIDQKIWGIHAGNLGQVNNLFSNEKESCVALGWENIGDLKKLKNNREAFKEAIIKAYLDTKTGAVPTSKILGQSCLKNI
jgi:restriction system protein